MNASQIDRERQIFKRMRRTTYLGLAGLAGVAMLAGVIVHSEAKEAVSECTEDATGRRTLPDDGVKQQIRGSLRLEHPDWPEPFLSNQAQEMFKKAQEKWRYKNSLCSEEYSLEAASRRLLNNARRFVRW